MSACVSPLLEGLQAIEQLDTCCSLPLTMVSETFFATRQGKTQVMTRKYPVAPDNYHVQIASAFRDMPI